VASSRSLTIRQVPSEASPRPPLFVGGQIYGAAPEPADLTPDPGDGFVDDPEGEADLLQRYGDRP
jgi:hypothetical protein